jgi:hypothetical protein
MSVWGVCPQVIVDVGFPFDAPAKLGKFPDAIELKLSFLAGALKNF